MAFFHAFAGVRFITISSVNMPGRASCEWLISAHRLYATWWSTSIHSKRTIGCGVGSSGNAFLCARWNWLLSKVSEAFPCPMTGLPSSSVWRSCFVLDDDAYDLLGSGRDYAGTLQQPLAFANTMRLRLSFRHSCDLIWLLNGYTLPRLQHLHVTQEKLRHDSCRCDQLSFYSLRAEDFDGSRVGCAHLHSLQLRQVPMDVLITLITHLESIRDLESFVLSNCSVEGTYRCEQRCVYSSLFSSLDRVALRTSRNCIANRFTRLRRLEFVFYLPVETMLEEVDLNWFHLGHDAVHSHVEKILLLYTSPYLFDQQRHLSNHACEQTSTSNETMEHLQWTLDCDPSSVSPTLTHLQRVHSLSLSADIQVRSRRADDHDAHRARPSRSRRQGCLRGPLSSHVCVPSNSTSTGIRSKGENNMSGPWHQWSIDVPSSNSCVSVLRLSSAWRSGGMTWKCCSRIPLCLGRLCESWTFLWRQANGTFRRCPWSDSCQRRWHFHSCAISRLVLVGFPSFSTFSCQRLWQVARVYLRQLGSRVTRVFVREMLAKIVSDALTRPSIALCDDQWARSFIRAETQLRRPTSPDKKKFTLLRVRVCEWGGYGSHSSTLGISSGLRTEIFKKEIGPIYPRVRITFHPHPCVEHQVQNESAWGWSGKGAARAVSPWCHWNEDQRSKAIGSQRIYRARESTRRMSLCQRKSEERFERSDGTDATGRSCRSDVWTSPRDWNSRMRIDGREAHGNERWDCHSHAEDPHCSGIRRYAGGIRSGIVPKSLWWMTVRCVVPVGESTRRSCRRLPCDKSIAITGVRLRYASPCLTTADSQRRCFLSRWNIADESFEVFRCLQTMNRC